MGTRALETLSGLTKRQRRASVLGALLMVLVALAWWGGRQLWARHELRQGQAALEQEAFTDALRHFDRCLSVWPDSIDAHLGAARAARRADDLARAQTDLQACQRLHPSRPEVALEAALLEAQRGGVVGQPGTFVAYLDHVCPEKYLIQEARAKGFLQIDCLEEAQGCLEDVLRHQPDHFQGRLLRGRLSEILHREADALRDYRRALDRRPESSEARIGVARNLDRLGQTDEAGRQYEQALAAHPENLEARLGTARWHTRSGRYADAHRLLDEFSAASAADAPTLVECARLALAEQHAAEAERLVRQALAVDAYHRPAYLLLADALQLQGEAEQANQQRTRAEQLDADERRLPVLKGQVNATPSSVPLLFELGTVLLRLGQVDHGEQALQAVLHLEPGHAGARKALAERQRVLAPGAGLSKP